MEYDKERETRGVTQKQSILDRGRAALVIAHPSHELRVHGWLEIAEPLVFVWTNGSGRSGQSRLDWTTRVLERAGAKPGSIYGRLTDSVAYAAVLNSSHDLFINLTEELADELVRHQVDYVVGDAVEGHNVTHEVGRLMIGAAVEIASRRGGKKIQNFDFNVVGPPDDCPDELKSAAIRLWLDDDSFKRKLEAAISHHPQLAADVGAAMGGSTQSGNLRFTERSVAEAAISLDPDNMKEYPELAAEARSLLDGIHLESFREEHLRPVGNRAGSRVLNKEPLFYEAYGEKLVEAGLYQQVIRHQEHIQPLAEALWNYVETTHAHQTTE